MQRQWMLSIIGAAVAVALSPQPTLGGTIYRVRMNTHAWNGKQGYVVVALTSGLKGTLGEPQEIQIRNWVNDGYRGTLLMTGGGKGGDLGYYIGQEPAPLTTLGNVETNGSRPRTSYFYSHAIGNFALREGPEIGVPLFGDSVRFDLELPLPTVRRAGFQDQVYVQVLNVHDTPAFPTADPFGANAICAFTARPSGGGAWAMETFRPAVLVPARGGEPATISITFPDSAVGASVPAR